MYLDNMKKWKNHSFSSGTVNGEDFKSFARALKFCLNKNVKEIKSTNGNSLFSLEAFNTGHYEVTGFIKNKMNGKIVYFATLDVRNGYDWYSKILVRTALNLKDYRGGQNNYTSLDNFFDKIKILTK